MPYLVSVLTSRDEYNMREYRTDSREHLQPIATALTIMAVRGLYRSLERFGWDRIDLVAEKVERPRCEVRQKEMF